MQILQLIQQHPLPAVDTNPIQFHFEMLAFLRQRLLIGIENGLHLQARQNCLHGVGKYADEVVGLGGDVDGTASG